MSGEINCSYSDPNFSPWNLRCIDPKEVEDAVAKGNAKKKQPSMSPITKEQMAKDGAAAIKASIQKPVVEAISYGLTITLAPLSIAGCGLPNDIIALYYEANDMKAAATDEATGIVDYSKYVKAAELYLQFLQKATASDNQDYLLLRDDAAASMLACIKAALPGISLDEGINLLDEEKIKYLKMFVQENANLESVLACFETIIQEISASSEPEKYPQTLINYFALVQTYFGENNLITVTENTAGDLQNYFMNWITAEGYATVKGDFSQFTANLPASILKDIYGAMLDSLLAQDPPAAVEEVAAAILEYLDAGGTIDDVSSDMIASIQEAFGITGTEETTSLLEQYASKLDEEELEELINLLDGKISSADMHTLQDDLLNTFKTKLDALLAQDPPANIEDVVVAFQAYKDAGGTEIITAPLGEYALKLDEEDLENLINLLEGKIPTTTLQALKDIHLSSLKTKLDTLLAQDPPADINEVIACLQEIYADPSSQEDFACPDFTSYFQALYIYKGNEECVNLTTQLETILPYDSMKRIYYELFSSLLPFSDVDNQRAASALGCVQRLEDFCGSLNCGIPGVYFETDSYSGPNDIACMYGDLIAYISSSTFAIDIDTMAQSVVGYVNSWVYDGGKKENIFSESIGNFAQDVIECMDKIATSETDLTSFLDALLNSMDYSIGISFCQELLYSCLDINLIHNFQIELALLNLLIEKGECDEECAERFIAATPLEYVDDLAEISYDMAFESCFKKYNSCNDNIFYQLADNYSIDNELNEMVDLFEAWMKIDINHDQAVDLTYYSELINTTLIIIMRDPTDYNRHSAVNFLNDLEQTLPSACDCDVSPMIHDLKENWGLLVP